MYYCEGVVIKPFLTTYYSIVSINCKMSFLKIMIYQPVFHSQHLKIYTGMWQPQIEIQYYSITYSKCITMFEELLH